MGTKKYFKRILRTMIVFATIISVFLSIAFYFNFINERTEQYKKEKQIETAQSAKEVSNIFSLSNAVANAVSKYPKTEAALASGEGFDEVLDYAYSIFGEGYVYIVDENETIIKRQDSPLLSDFVLEKSKGALENDFLLGYIQKGTSYVAHINSRQTDAGRKIFVVRVFETENFLNRKSLTAQNFALITDSNEIYVDGKNTGSEIRSLINTAGSREAFEQVESGRFKGKESFVVAASLDCPQHTNAIFSYDNTYIEGVRFAALMYAIVVCIAALAVLGLTGWFASIVIYYPLDELIAFTKKYSKEERADDEIAYISNAFKAVDKTVELLKDEAKKDYELLKIHFIKDLLTGIVFEDDIPSLLEKFEMSNCGSPFYVGILEISDYEALEEVFGERELSKIKRQICEFVDGELMGRSISKTAEIDSKRFAVVMYGCDISKIRQDLSYIISVINGEFDVEIFAAIGSSCDNLLDINQSYTSAARVFENSFAAGFRSSIVTADDMEASVGFYYPVNLERDLISSVIRLKKEESIRIVNDILDENMIGKTLTKERHNAMVFAFSATINRIVEALNKTTADIFGEDNIIFLELKMCSEAAQFRTKIVQSFEKIIEYMTGSDEADLSQRLLDYIHSHYNEDISLNDIGGHFELSQCYISTVFKEATGENFKDYLSRYRIKKAKEILTKNPSVKTKELAAMIGCNTVATLFRLFNKYEGMSPGQFVKNLN